MPARSVRRSRRSLRGPGLRLAGCVAVAVGFASGCHGSWIQPAFRGPERTLRTTHYRIVSDASAASLVRLAEAAEAMHAELERLLPRAPGAEDPTRKLLAFRDVERFKRYLGDHFFADARAIGFYCDLGGEIALPWSDPPTPEDVRVLRHEVAHQHLAARLSTRLPAWLEEGLAERLALGAGLGTPALRDAAGLNLAFGAASTEASASAPFAAPLGMREALRVPTAPSLRGWAEYQQHRALLDAVFASLSLAEDAASWDALAGGASDVPEPGWSGGRQGYVLHLQFIRFIEAETGALPGGALRAVLDRAQRGDSSALDLSGRFHSLGALDRAFHNYVRRAGLHALVVGAEDPPGLDAAEAAPDLLSPSRCSFHPDPPRAFPPSEAAGGARPRPQAAANTQRP